MHGVEWSGSECDGGDGGGCLMVVTSVVVVLSDGDECDRDSGESNQ